jgi:glycosyltransferase involved in cell wall biosynthesis
VVKRSFVFAVPGDLATPTGGYAYDRRMIAELARLGWHADVVDVGSEFPRPSPAARALACARLMATPQDRCIVVDGLALGALPEAARDLGASRKLVALVHHPLALETGLSRDDAEALRQSERAALSAAHHVVVTSATTAHLLAADYAVPAERITVALPGVDAVACKAEDRRAGPVTLLSVGALVPRKGYDVLLAALGRIRDLPWQLTIVGARDRSPATAAEIEATIAELGLAQRVILAGAVSDARLAALYATADVFVLASRFEGYGMAIAEAVAYGKPVVATHAGAVPDTLPCGAGILVQPNDSAALAAALRSMIGNDEERRRFAAYARAAAARLPTWPQSAAVMSRVLEAMT